MPNISLYVPGAIGEESTLFPQVFAEALLMYKAAMDSDEWPLFCLIVPENAEVGTFVILVSPATI